VWLREDDANRKVYTLARAAVNGPFGRAHGTPLRQRPWPPGAARIRPRQGRTPTELPVMAAASAPAPSSARRAAPMSLMPPRGPRAPRSFDERQPAAAPGPGSTDESASQQQVRAVSSSNQRYASARTRRDAGSASTHVKGRQVLQRVEILTPGEPEGRCRPSGSTARPSRAGQRWG